MTCLDGAVELSLVLKGEALPATPTLPPAGQASSSVARREVPPPTRRRPWLVTAEVWYFLV